MPSRKTKTDSPPRTADTHFWHLATNASEVHLTDLEFALMRTFESFVRWEAECIGSSTGHTLSGNENTLLHVICMRNQPKEMKDLQRITNRQDVANIQYGLRKLLKLGLIEKTGSGRTGVFYSATPPGVEACERFAKLRQDVLMAALRQLPRFDSANDSAIVQLVDLERAYETASRELASFHRKTRP